MAVVQTAVKNDVDAEPFHLNTKDN